MFTHSVAPESMHTVGSMETRNLDLWDTIFCDDVWRSCDPIAKAPCFGSTHIRGTSAPEESVPLATGQMPLRFHGMYENWSAARCGWAVLVPNRFLSDASFHTGDTPMWTQGHVVGEATEVGSGLRKVVVELGGFPTEFHLHESEVRIAMTPHSGAMGSEGGHGYEWKKRQHNFPPSC